MKTVALAALLLFAAPDADPLKPFDRFIGRWEGTTRGKAGDGATEREWRRVLGGKYIEVRNVSVYPKERHEDVGMWSFDKQRSRFVLRQFHVEGFVNQYAIEKISDDGNTMVASTEAIENIPAGWRARETYRIIGADEYEEVFELAAPGKPFEEYSRSRLKRKK